MNLTREQLKEALGFQIKEIEQFTCCGAPSMTIDLNHILDAKINKLFGPAGFITVGTDGENTFIYNHTNKTLRVERDDDDGN